MKGTKIQDKIFKNIYIVSVITYIVRSKENQFQKHWINSEKN